MAIGSVDTLPVSSQTPPLTPTAAQAQKKRAAEYDISENGSRNAELAEYQEASSAQDSDEEGLTFWDVLDVVNPLQHIPIVNTIYRELTGDTIASGAKLAGGALFFGPIGLGFAALDVGVKEMTGAAIDEHVVAMVKGEDAGENARQAAAADDAKKAAKMAKATGAETPVASAQAAPVATVERTAPLGLFDAAQGTPAAQAAAPAASPVAVTAATAPLGLIGTVSPVSAATQATAAKVVQEANARPQTLESTRPRARLARNSQPTPDHLAMAMQAQGLEASKLMTVPSRSATAVSAQMIASEKSGREQTAAAPASRQTAPTQLVTVPASGLSVTSSTQPAATPTAEAAAGPVDVPAWFDSAMMKASSAYQKTNRVTSAP
ncbi:hypothetical protein [Novispirillum itersonii]|uniref:hypothetical protein n=1 Tax=Novispirillum itersonii TaxID=189 RepID=UPI000367D5D6|nr:hypothetical protein [Novispirillum itersonii]